MPARKQTNRYQTKYYTNNNRHYQFDSNHSDFILGSPFSNATAKKAAMRFDEQFNGERAEKFTEYSVVRKDHNGRGKYIVTKI